MTDKKLNILVVPSDRAGVGYFRSTQPHLFIAAKYYDEVNVDICYDLSHMQNFQEFLQGYDILHFHKALDPKGIIVSTAKQMGILTIGDIDDNWDLGDFHPMSSAARLEKWHEPILANLRAADYVSTTTSIFADKVRKMANKNVIVLPNALSQYESQFMPKPVPSKKIRFGFICGSSHLKDLELVKDMMKKIPQETLDKIQIVLCGFDTRGNSIITDVTTGKKTVRPIKPEESVWCEYERIVTNNYSIIKDQEYIDYLKKYTQGADYPSVDEQPYRRIWNRPITEYATLYNYIDVLLAPIRPCDFNLVKSQLKVIEAGWFCKGIIASNFGPYTLDIRNYFLKNGEVNHNGNGLLVDQGKDHKQWAKYIIKLAEHPEYIQEMGFNLHNEIIRKYNIETVSDTRYAIYKDLLEKKRSK